MKKLFVCFLLVCIIAMSVVACTKTSSENAGQSNSVSETVDNTHTDPPCVLRFESLEGVIELKGMLEKSDEEINEYLSAKPFNMNALNSKEDINTFFDKIGNLPILYLKESSGYKLTGIDHNITYGVLGMTYVNNNGHIRFERYLSDSTKLKYAVETDKIKNPDFKEAKEKLTILNKPITFGVMDETENFYRVFSIFSIFDSRIRLVLADKSNKGFDLNAIEQNIVETTLNELMQQKQVE